jgi:hypothetical protein
MQLCRYVGDSDELMRAPFEAVEDDRDGGEPLPPLQRFLN